MYETEVTRLSPRLDGAEKASNDLVENMPFTMNQMQCLS